MKTQKHCIIIIVILTITALAFIVCNKDDSVCDCPEGTTRKIDEWCCSINGYTDLGYDCECPIAREFIISGDDWGYRGKKIIVRDTRTDPKDTGLDELGIISKLEKGLGALPTSNAPVTLSWVFNRGLEIIVEQTTKYNGIRPLSGNEMGIDLPYILTADHADIEEELEYTLESMKLHHY